MNIKNTIIFIIIKSINIKNSIICVINIIIFTIIKIINIKNSIIHVINIIIFTIINSINIKNSIIFVINIVEQGSVPLLCFLSGIAAGGIASSTKSYWVWLRICRPALQVQTHTPGCA
jgi:hypothetical protein